MAQPKVSYIPKDFHTITPYLAVKDALKFSNFIKEGLGGVAKEVIVVEGQLRHGELIIGNSVVMISEAGPMNPVTPSTLYLYVSDCDAAYKRAMAWTHGKITSTMQPTDMFWGDRTAAVKDEWNVSWYLSTHIEDLSPEQLKERMAAHKPSSSTNGQTRGQEQCSDCNADPCACGASSSTNNGQKRGHEQCSDCNADPCACAASSPKKTKSDYEWPEIKLHRSEKGAALGYCVICVSDMDKSIKWYQDVFGFKVRGKSDKFWTEFDCGNTALALHLVDKKGHSAGDKHAGQAAPSFFVANLDAFHKRAVEYGVQVVSAPARTPWGGNMAGYRDPDGCSFSVVEEPKQHGSH